MRRGRFMWLPRDGSEWHFDIFGGAAPVYSCPAIPFLGKVLQSAVGSVEQMSTRRPKNLESRSWRTGCRSGTTSSGRTPIHRECPTLRQPCQVAFGIFWIRLTRLLLHVLGLVSKDNYQMVISWMMFSVYAPSQYRPATNSGYTVYYY